MFGVLNEIVQGLWDYIQAHGKFSIKGSLYYRQGRYSVENLSVQGQEEWKDGGTSENWATPKLIMSRGGWRY